VARKGKRVRDRRAQADGDTAAESSRVDRNGSEDGAPEPLEHATPDAELAEAQLEVGRPDEVEDEDLRADIEEFEREAEEAAVTTKSVAVAEKRPGIGARTVNFVQGSWRELQRVQWPDRRQVMQATGVVLGFVIAAGLFLGAADYVAQKLVNFILK
jgi:preprotein translocase SecE subunit